MWPSEVLISGQSTAVGSHFVAMFLSRTVVFGPPLAHDSLSGSWPLDQGHTWAPSNGEGLESNHTVLASSHSVCQCVCQSGL